MKVIPLLFLLIWNVSLAQKNETNYYFDHLLEYEYRDEENSSPKTVYYLTNSKINDFHIVAEKRKEIGDSLYVNFIDFKGRSSSFNLKEEDFFSENFLMNCQIVKILSNPYKYKTKRYHFVPEKDTVLVDHKYQVYVLKNEKEKKEKRLKECRFHYIMEKGTEYHLAAVVFHLANAEWQKERSLPNGIPRLIYHTNSFQNDHHIYNLRKISGIDKHLEITGNCK